MARESHEGLLLCLRVKEGEKGIVGFLNIGALDKNV